jgi:hypothetical protein
LLLKKQVQSLHQHWKYPNGSLLEGNFKSMFENRVLAFEQTKFKTKGVANKMIVISDGDLIKSSK